MTTIYCNPLLNLKLSLEEKDFPNIMNSKANFYV
jgi:hypothetical protein